MTRFRFEFAFAVSISLVASFLSLPFASAQESLSIAVFGDNEIDDYLNSNGFEATIVSDADLSTEGFLADFDAFFYTRDDANTPGASLSSTAAANVQDYVGSSGRGVLLNGDFADTLLGESPDTEVQQLISNATSWAAETHHGFVGEYTGAVAGLTSNSDELTPLGFVSGSAGTLSDGPADGDIVETTAGEGSQVLAGVDFPLTDPTGELSFGSIVTGVDSSLVLARYSNPGQPNDGNPAIINFSLATADLSIDKTDEPDPVTAGGALLYTLTVANSGPDAATNVVVVDALPSGTTFVSAEGDGWNCGEDDGEVVCTRSSVPADEAAPDIEIVVETTTAGTITNVADVSADEDDPVAANNHVEEVTTVRSQSTPDSATAFCPDGCTVTTDTGAGASPDDNTISTLIVPDDADPQTVSITEVAATTDPDFCGGQTCSGQLVEITDITGVANPNEPIVLEITYDKTVKGGSQIYILKPGFTSPQRVANCTTPGIASPHPCVSAKTVLANGDRMFTILLLSGDPILGKR